MQYQIPVPHLTSQGALVAQNQGSVKAEPKASRLPFHRPTTLYPFDFNPPIVAVPFVPYPLSQPGFNSPDSRYSPTGPRPQLDGATNQQTYVFPTNQYEQRYYAPDVNRYLGNGPTKQFEGTQTFIFPIQQPDFRNYSRNTFSSIVPPIDVSQQTYIFPTSQPQGYTPFVTRPDIFLPIAGRTITFGTSFIFPVNQPEFRYYVPDINRYPNGANTFQAFYPPKYSSRTKPTTLWTDRIFRVTQQYDAPDPYDTSDPYDGVQTKFINRSKPTSIWTNRHKPGV